MSRLIDLTGERFGRLTVLQRAESRTGHTMWDCVCDCGNHTTVYGTHLRRGNTRSCGCLNSDETRERSLTHGDTHDRLYQTWQNMKNRCYNPNVRSYIRYGARGIQVCEQWRNDFVAFKAWAIMSGYTEELTIDRIDPNGDYTPENCRWATVLEQANNTRTNRYLEFQGEIHTMAEWSRILGIPYTTILTRLNREGKSVEEAFKKKGQQVVFNEH